MLDPGRRGATAGGDGGPALAIGVQGLRKIYRGRGAQPGKEALKGIDLAVSRGTVFGRLGPNGAGKSTLINIPAGLVVKIAGIARIWGFDIDANPAMTEDVRELAEDTDAVSVREATKGKARTTMIGRFGARSRVQEGEVAEVAVDTRSLHFFDPETGLGIYDEAGRKGDSA